MVRRAGWRFALYYAAMFAGPGVTLPFLPAFLAGRGLDAAEVASALVAQQIARLVSAPLAGRAADAFGRRRRAAALAAFSGVVASLLMVVAQPALLLPASLSLPPSTPLSFPSAMLWH